MYKLAKCLILFVTFGSVAVKTELANGEPLPRVEYKSIPGGPPGVIYRTIDGVPHGPSSPASTTRYLYGLRILEENSNATRQLRVGSVEVPGQIIGSVEARLPRGESPVRLENRSGKWAQAPLDGVFEDGQAALCRAPAHTLFRSNTTQIGTGPVAPRIASFTTLRNMRKSLANDLAALKQYEPWSASACDVNFEQLSASLESPLARAYLSAWRAELPSTPASLAFSFTSNSVSETFLDQFRSVERDLQGDLNTRRVSAALAKLSEAARSSPDLLDQMHEALSVIMERWLNPSCRKILYATGTIPSEPYIFKTQLRSDTQLHVLLRVWEALERNPLTAVRLDAERLVKTSPSESSAALRYMIAHYNAPDAEPDIYDASKLGEFRLIGGYWENSKLGKQTHLSLLSGASATKNQAEPAGGPNRYEFDPRRWRMILEFHRHRVLDEFYARFHAELFAPQVSSQLYLTDLKERILANTALARELGRPAPWPWDSPRFARQGVEENSRGQQGSKLPFLRWYDDEVIDSAVALTVPVPIANGLWSDTLGLRFVADIDNLEWAIYNRVVEELLRAIDVEITRIQFAAGYTELGNTLSAVETADQQQSELVFGGEPFRLEECAPGSPGEAFVAGHMIARISPAYRHVLHLDLEADDPLFASVTEQSRVSVVLSSLIVRPTDRAPPISIRSADKRAVYLASKWSAAARFSGRVLGVYRDGAASQLEIEVVSQPEQDTIDLPDPPVDLSGYPGVRKTEKGWKLQPDAGIFGGIERATAVVMPTSEFERARLRSAIEAAAL